MRKRPAGIPIGVERVLYLARTDEDFREALMADREAAMRRPEFKLSAQDAALLRGIPGAQLAAVIDAIDTSPRNLRRRELLGLVAATTATVGVTQVVSGCFTGSDPEEPAPQDSGPDQGEPSEDGGAEGDQATTAEAAAAPPA